jgi:collagenase-like PrtC family protease
MLTFSTATNWDDNLLRGIDTADAGHEVTEIFGKLASDFVGGGRPAYAQPRVNKRRAARHIQAVRDTGRRFNYLLNAVCLDNREFTRAGQKEIRALLSWLDSLRVEAVTVSNPYLGRVIKKEYPRFRLVVSAHAFVDSIDRARFWAEDIGADRITLHGDNRIARNFRLLGKIRAQLKCELQLIANGTCLYECPLRAYHTSFLAHASQSLHPLEGFGIDWCLINCRHRLLSNPEEFIHGPWIRPEDTGYYERIGIDNLKIIDRIRDTQSILSAVKAYLERKFDGNLVDFILRSQPGIRSRNSLRTLKFFLRPLQINVFKLGRFSELFSETGLSVDNRKLDGFLEYFWEGKCSGDGCRECGYCREVARKCIAVDTRTNEMARTRLREAMESLTAGDVFKYW